MIVSLYYGGDTVYPMLNAGSNDDFPGYYFTNDEVTAMKGGKYVSEFEYHYDNLVCVDRRRKNIKETILTLIDYASDKSALLNWGDTVKQGREAALDYMLVSGGNEIEILHNVFREFYPNDPTRFLSVLRKHGYDGVKFEYGGGLINYIVFDLSDINRIKMIRK